MTSPPKVVLLIGSAKLPGRSSSESLGRYMCDRLVDYGWAMQVVHLHQVLRTAARTQAMLTAVGTADLVILATPLYVDSLPYLVTDALERIATHRAEQSSIRESPRFVAVINCGFPEPEHNAVAIAICRRFAKSAGMGWAGGMSMGGGGFVHGAPLTEHGPRADGIRRALEAAAAALAVRLPVPDEAIALLAQPVIPSRLYTTIGNLGWYSIAWKQGSILRLRDRPYA